MTEPTVAPRDPSRLQRLVADQRVAFLAVGLVNTAIGFGLFIVFDRTIGVALDSSAGPVVGTLVVLLSSHVIAVLCAFVLHRRFVFRVRGHVLRDLARFESVYLVALGINAVTLPVLVQLGVDRIIAQGAILATTTVLSYVGHRYFSFRRPSESATAAQPVAAALPRSRWSMAPLAAAAVVLLVTTCVSLLGANGNFGSVDVDKVWLAALWVGTAVVAALSLPVDRLLRSRRMTRAAAAALTAVALVGLVAVLVFAAWQEPPFPVLPTIWSGFSPLSIAVGVALTAAVLAVALRHVARPRLLLVASVALVAAVAILPLIQTPGTFRSGYDNAFTLDELLAPSTGRLPGFDYISQYSQLLGYPLALVAALVPAQFAAYPDAFAVTWMSLMQALTVALAVAVPVLLAPRRIRWLPPLLVVPVLLLPGPDGLEYFAALPLRLLLPVVLLATVALLARRQSGGRWPWWQPLAIGAVAGATVLNNLDQGAPATLAAAIALAAASLSLRSAAASIGLFAAGTVSVPVIYVLIGTLTGQAFHADYLLFFVSQFGVGGFNNIDMPAVGLHSGFVLLGVIGAVVGFLGLRRLRGRNRVLSLAITFQSAFLLLALVYYSGRSLTPTLVTGSALPAAVLLALLAVAAYPHARALHRAGPRSWRAADWMSATLIIVGLVVPLAAWSTVPALLGRSVTRLSHPDDAATTVNYLLPDPTAAVEAVPEGTDLIGMLAVSGSTWSERLDVVNASLFLHPDYLAFSGGAALQCSYLATLPGDQLLTTRELLTTLADEPRCRRALAIGDAVDLVTDSSGSGRPVQWVLVPRA